MALPPFQTFLDRHAAELLRFLVAIVGPDEAEDCFQETCLAALRTYPRLPEGSDLRAWAFTIARRKAIDAARARVRRPTPGLEDGDGGSRDTQLGGAPGGTSDPSLVRTDPGGPWAPLAALPPKQRAAVFLRVAVDLPHREVAKILDCSEDAARRSAHEGLKRLREEMT